MLSHFNSEGARAIRKLAERENRIMSGYLHNTDREVRATAARPRKWAERVFEARRKPKGRRPTFLD